MVKVKLQYLILVAACLVLLSFHSEQLHWLWPNSEPRDDSTPLSPPTQLVNENQARISSSISSFGHLPPQTETLETEVVPAELLELEKGGPVGIYTSTDTDIPPADPNNPDDSGLITPTPPSKTDIEVIPDELSQIESQPRENMFYQGMNDELPEL